MTVTHEIVEGRIICGLCPKPSDPWALLSLPQFEKHLRIDHGAPYGIAFEGEVRTPGWPYPDTQTVTSSVTMTIENGPTPSVEDLPSPTDLLARMQEDREVRWDRELRLAAIGAAAQVIPRKTIIRSNADRTADAVALLRLTDAIYRELADWIGDTP